MTEKSNRGLCGYGSRAPMTIECVFRAVITLPDSIRPSLTATFHVVPQGNRSLLGRYTASDMGLLQVGNAINNCETAHKVEQFPKMPGVKVRFSIDKTVPPVKSAYYNVPAAFR